ncbi:hypothetical protein [Pyruvatibacter sp.]|uniref:hypothetical protein n=1 Tax=Pyruvatibacter sp. TaxID=1981328 RepID=UPI0032EE711B
MISNTRYWLFMSIAAFLATLLARYGIPDGTPAPILFTQETAIALAAGAATLLVLPAALVIPWRQVQRTRRTVTNTPLYAGTALFAMLAFVALIGAAISGS